MDKFNPENWLSAEPSEQHLHRCQRVLQNVHGALAYSEKLEAAMQDAIRASTGLSRQLLEKKLLHTFGEPSKHDMYLAKKAIQELVSATHNSRPEQVARRPFMVNNPI